MLQPIHTTVNLMGNSTWCEMKNEILTLYYTPIITEVICSNNSGPLIATATTTLSFDPNGKFVGVSIDGTTEHDAKRKLIDFFSDDKGLVMQLID